MKQFLSHLPLCMGYTLYKVNNEYESSPKLNAPMSSATENKLYEVVWRWKIVVVVVVVVVIKI